MRETAVRLALPISDESGAPTAPNAFAHILLEWLGATARAANVPVGRTLFWMTWTHW